MTYLWCIELSHAVIIISSYCAPPCEMLAVEWFLRLLGGVASTRGTTENEISITDCYLYYNYNVQCIYITHQAGVMSLTVEALRAPGFLHPWTPSSYLEAHDRSLDIIH